MIVSIIVTVCHVASAPVCHEEIVSQADGSIGLGCLISEGQALTEWKKHSIYSGPQWEVKNVKCVAGNEYVIKDRI